MIKVALINANVFNSVAKQVRTNQSILIEGGIITQIEDMSHINLPNDYKVYDLQGKYVFPGLINAHTHLFGSGKPMKAISGGKSQERLVKLLNTNLGCRILDKMVEDHAKTALFSGVTTIRGVGDLFFSDVRLRNRVENHICIGPRLLVSGPAISVTGGHGAGSFANISDSPWEARKLARQNVHEQVDFIKICVTGGVTDSRKVGEAGLLKMTLEEIEAICEEAHKIGLKVAAHAESTEGVRLALQGGVDTIEHGGIFDDEILDLFIHNPKALNGSSYLIPTLYPAIVIAKLKKEDTLMNDISIQNSKLVFDGMVQGIKQAKEAGVLVGMGTDASCPFVTQYNAWREISYVTRYAKIAPEDAILFATKNNAKILDIHKLTGSIEKGKAADLLVMKNNPLKDIKSLSEIDMVFCGEQIYENPKYKKLEQIDSLLDTI